MCVLKKMSKKRIIEGKV